MGEAWVSFEHGDNPKIIGCSVLKGVFSNTLSVVIESSMKKGCDIKSNKSRLCTVIHAKDFSGPGKGWTYLSTDRKFNYFGKIV